MERSARRSHVAALPVAALALLLLGCNTFAQVRKLEYDQLLAEQRNLQTLARALDGGSFPPEHGFRVFVSAEAINELLAGASGLSFPVESLKDVEVTVASLRLLPADGFSKVEVAASARHSCCSAEVTLVASAKLEPVAIEDPPRPTMLGLRLLVDDVKPEVKWSPFRLRFGKFVRSLLRLEAAEYADGFPLLLVKTTEDLDLKIPGRSESAVPVGSAEPHVVFLTDEIRFRRTLDIANLKHVFFEEGAHIYYGVHTEMVGVEEAD